MVLDFNPKQHVTAARQSLNVSLWRNDVIMRISYGPPYR